MDPDVLREQLLRLHEELAKAQRVDPRASELLGELGDDIKRLNAPLSERGEGRSVGTAEASSLTSRLEKIAVQFEVDHPTLAASSRRLIDLLGKAGL